MNPFFETWDTPFGLPPFDRIKPAHFPEALDRGMAEALDEVAAITAQLEPPSFANTIEAMERSGRLLTKVSNVFSNLLVSLGGAALQQVQTDYAPKLAAHGMKVMLDAALFARVDTLFRARDTLGLAPDQLRLLERTHLGFIRSGAALQGDARARMAELTERLASLHARFGQNVVHDEREWGLELGEADLAGLPEFVVEGARQAAAERGKTGHIVTLSRSLIDPFLTFSARRDLRKIAYQASIARGAHPGAHDNTKLIPEILALRVERARLLGYSTYAEFRLADTMAGSVAAVARLTDEVWAAACRRAGEERATLLARAQADGVNDGLAPWDWRYYAEKERAERYAIDEAELKPYFVLENMQQAAFDCARRLFGLDFVPLPHAATYHPDVTAYEVRDAGGHVGVFIIDPFARPDKRSGAWMSSFRDQEALDEPITPIVINNLNFAKASPALLSYDDAETLFHEFGHALHGLLSKVRYPSQSGTSVRRDFVELPSQIMEHWLEEREVLRRYARHHETGAPIPDALMDKLLAARKFNQGFATVEYLGSAILDMELHALTEPAGIDVLEFERAAMERIGMPAEIGARHRSAHFQHLFNGAGYAAGYYSYLWAEVLDADGYAAFAGDPFAAAPAARLKRLLSAGDSEDPMELYLEFRGSAPQTQALLRQRGLVEA